MKSYCAPKENETFVYTREYSMHILDTYNWNEPCLSLLPGSFLRTPDTGVVVGYSNSWEIQSGDSKYYIGTRLRTGGLLAGFFQIGGVPCPKH